MQTTASRTRTLGPGEGEAVSFLGSPFVTKLDGDVTEGRFDLIEAVGPAGDMPPLHVHHSHDEVFYVLEGEMSFHVGAETFTGGPGTTAFAPRGIPHVYRVESDSARWLAMTSPAGFADFVSAVVAAGEVDPGTLAAIAAEHDIEILGPPGMLPAQLSEVGEASRRAELAYERIVETARAKDRAAKVRPRSGRPSRRRLRP
ncbi:MAG TPA: quercetin 2,3-dioxygenase [Gaiellaceae bacterium]|jgi:quercetin dioxygenase-like cupin family protein